MREKKWDGKINVSQICSSHTLKTIKSGKEFQENKLLEFFIACLLLNFILKRSNSEPPNYRREQVTVLGKNQKKFKSGCKENLNQDTTIKFEPGLLLKKNF